MTRKMNMSETSIQKMRADNYALKMALDEIKSKKGDQKVQKKEPKKIVEMLVFEQKKTEPDGDKIKEDVFVLKEVVGNKSNLKTAGNVDVFESSENKENTEEEMEVKPRRRGARTRTGRSAQRRSSQASPTRREIITKCLKRKCLGKRLAI